MPSPEIAAYLALAGDIAQRLARASKLVDEAHGVVLSRSKGPVYSQVRSDLEKVLLSALVRSISALGEPETNARSTRDRGKGRRGATPEEAMGDLGEYGGRREIMANDRPAEHPFLSRANFMREDTLDYGRQWQTRLRQLASERAKGGKFPIEFPFPDGKVWQQESKGKRPREWTPEAVEREIAGAVARKVRHATVRNPVVVLIGGGGAAGKTMFAIRLEDRLKKDHDIQSVERLELDHYFLPIELIAGRESDGKYDNPLNSYLLKARKNIEAMKGTIVEEAGQPLIIPYHDRKKHLLANQTFVERDDLTGAQVVLVDGLYCLGPDLCELGDICIYVDASPLDRAKGRVWRDILVRERDEQHVVEMLMGRETYHQTFVESTQCVADYIVRRDATGGRLTVMFDKEIKWAFETACKELGLEQKAKELFERFQHYQEQKTEERKEKTEF